MTATEAVRGALAIRSSTFPLVIPAAVGAHTAGTWRVSTAAGGAIVSDLPTSGFRCQADCLAYYGGHLIAESVSAENRPLIAIAPLLLDFFKAAESMAFTVGHPDASASMEEVAIKWYEGSRSAVRDAVSALGVVL